MKAVAAYMAYKSGQQRGGDGGRRSEYSETGMRDYGNRRSEYGAAESRVYSAERQPNQYSARNAMDEDLPEDVEMRRRRDSRGRYMTEEDMPPESRYRGRDGRWRSGTRRSEYEGGADDNYPTDRRMDGYMDGEKEKKYVEPVPQKNVIPWPYMPPNVPPVAPENRLIGFSNREPEMPRSHYDAMRKEAEAGAPMWVQPPEVEGGGEEKLDKKSMEKWVHGMKDGKEEPLKPWTVEEVKPLAMRFGYPTSGEKFDEFYTALHMVKSDYCAVAEDFDVNIPAFYAALADAWLKDPDAALHGREKLEAYHKYIVKGKK